MEGWPLVHCVVAAVSHSFKAFRRSFSLVSDTFATSGLAAGPDVNPIPRATDASVFIHAALAIVDVVLALTSAFTTVVVVTVCEMFVKAHLHMPWNRSCVF